MYIIQARGRERATQLTWHCNLETVRRLLRVLHRISPNDYFGAHIVKPDLRRRFSRIHPANLCV
jgi:hypothetical protein